MCCNKLGPVLWLAALPLLAMLVSHPAWYARQRPDLQTRWRMKTMKRAVAAYRSSHQGRCPLSLAQLEVETRVDGWQQPLIFVCPGAHDPALAAMPLG